MLSVREICIMDGDIPPKLIGELVDAIADAYRKKVLFDQMLRRKLDKDPRAVAPISSDDMRVVADAAVDNAGAEGWLHDLIEAVARDKSRNPFVKAFYPKYKAYTQGQQANNVPDAAPDVSYPPTTSPLTIFPSQEKQFQTHPFSEIQRQTIEHLSHDTDVESLGVRQVSPMAASPVLPQSQNGPQFSFRYFRDAGCSSSSIRKSGSSDIYGSSRDNLIREAFL